MGMNVYVVGVPTAGKSTLAKMIKAKMPQFNVVSFEAVRNGFLKSQPELEMGNRNSRARHGILPQFIVELADWNAKMTGCPTLVEGSFAKAEEVAKLKQKEDLLICLGYGEMTLEEVANRAIQKAGVKNYLYGKTADEFMRHFYDLTEDDRANREFCLKNDVPYFETAGERVGALEKAMRLVRRYCDDDC